MCVSPQGIRIGGNNCEPTELETEFCMQFFAESRKNGQLFGEEKWGQLIIDWHSESICFRNYAENLSIFTSQPYASEHKETTTTTTNEPVESVWARISWACAKKKSLKGQWKLVERKICNTTTMVTNGTFAKSFSRFFFRLFPFAGKTVGNVCERVYCRWYAARFTFFFFRSAVAVALSRVDDANVCEFVCVQACHWMYTYFWRQTNVKINFFVSAVCIAYCKSMSMRMERKINKYCIYTLFVMLLDGRTAFVFHILAACLSRDRHNRLIYFVKQLNFTRRAAQVDRSARTGSTHKSHASSEWMSEHVLSILRKPWHCTCRCFEENSRWKNKASVYL